MESMEHLLKGLTSSLFGNPWKLSWNYIGASKKNSQDTPCISMMTFWHSLWQIFIKIHNWLAYCWGSKITHGFETLHFEPIFSILALHEKGLQTLEWNLNNFRKHGHSGHKGTLEPTRASRGPTIRFGRIWSVNFGITFSDHHIQ